MFQWRFEHTHSTYGFKSLQDTSEGILSISLKFQKLRAARPEKEYALIQYVQEESGILKDKPSCSVIACYDAEVSAVSADTCSTA